MRNLKFGWLLTTILLLSVSNIMAQRTDAIPIIKYLTNNYSLLARAECDTCIPVVGKPLVVGKPIPLSLAAGIDIPGVDLNYVPGIIAPNFWGGGSPEIKGYVKNVAGMTRAWVPVRPKTDSLYFAKGAKGVAVGKSGRIFTSAATIFPNGGDPNDDRNLVRGIFSFKSTPSRMPLFNRTSDVVFRQSIKPLISEKVIDKRATEVVYIAVDPNDEKIIYASLKDPGLEELRILCRINSDGEWEKLNWKINGVARDVWGALTVDKDGNLYIADSAHHVIVKAGFDSDGKVKSWRIVAGKYGTQGFKNDNGEDARFNKPSGICVDKNGNIYVGDAGNNVIRKIDDDGDVTTYAGSSSGSVGLADNNDPFKATFNFPTAVAYNEMFKTLYVVDYRNKLIREIDSDKRVNTLAGTPISFNPAKPEKFFKSVYFLAAKLNNVADEMVFANPTGIAIDPSGFGLYVSDGLYIRYVSTFQAVFTITSAIRIHGTQSDTVTNPLLLPHLLPPGIFMDNENGSFSGFPLTKWEPTIYTISVLNSRGISLINGVIAFEVIGCPDVKDSVTESRTISPRQLPYTWNGRTFNNAENVYATLKNSTGCDSVVFIKLSVSPEFNYANEPYLLSFGQPIRPIVPATAGSRVDLYAVSPPLPNGLILNTSTGEITGTPVAYAGIQPVPAVGPQAPVQYSAPWRLDSSKGADITRVQIADANQRSIFENNTAFQSLQGSAGAGTGTPGAYTDFGSLAPIKMFTNTPYTMQLSNSLSRGNIGSSSNFSPGWASLNESFSYLNFMNSYAVYIDLNRDGDFVDAGERVYISAAPKKEAHTETVPLNLPVSALPGVTKMRIYCVEAQTYPWNYTFFDPSRGIVNQYYFVNRTTEQALSFYPNFSDISYRGELDFQFNLNYGEFEDYVIDIINPVTQSYSITGSNNVGTAQSTVKLAINTSSTSTTNSTICSNELPYNWNGLTFLTAGSQTARLVNQFGADSAATLNLSVKQATSSVVAVAACGAYMFNGTSYTQSGDYPIHKLNAAGCDSTINFRFRQKATASTTNIEIAPGQLPYAWNGLSVAAAGTRSVRLTNAEGCDSTATLVLHVLYNVYYPANTLLEVNKPMVAISPQIEGNYQVTVSSNGYNGYKIAPALPNGMQLNAFTGVISGTPTQLSPLQLYTITLGQDGARSSTFRLSVGVPTTSTDTVSNCGPYTWNGVVYDSASKVSASFKNQYGFDSTANLVLFIRNPSSFITHLFASASELPLTWNGMPVVREGTKTIYLVNAVGCDSAVTVNIVLNPKVSYGSPNILTPNQPIAPIVPQSTGGAMPSALGNVSTLMKATNLLPLSIALDTQENSYVSDEQSGNIYKITRRGTVSTVNGFGTTQAMLTTDKVGNLYVADRFSNRIMKKDTAGVVTVLVSASSPNGIAIDSAGNVYFSEGRYHRIRKISSAGVVSTLAGGTTAGYANGIGMAAKFNTPLGLSTDAAGNVYVADSGNNRIRKISPAGNVTSMAGNGAATSIDGIVSNASFNAPIAIATDNLGNKYVVDNGSSKIRKIDSAGNVNTIAGTSVGYQDGGVSQARFNLPTSLTTDSHGQVYVADKANRAIRQINAMNYTIQPALVNGLQFDVATGVISGTPANTLPQPVTYTIHAFNSAGADSSKVVVAVCNPVATSFSIDTCNQYVWNDSTYTSNTTHTRTLKNRGGCDSVVTMRLIIRKSSTGPTTTASACSSFVWLGTTYDKTGIYTKVYTNAVGCDSTIYLNLTIKAASANNLFADITKSQFPYKWRDKTFAEPGTQSVVLVNSVGCDSVLSMTVRISEKLPNISYAIKDTTLYWDKTIEQPITMSSSGTPIPILKIGQRDTLIRFSTNGPGDHINNAVKGTDGAYYATVYNDPKIYKLNSAGVWTVFANAGQPINGGMVSDKSGNLYAATNTINVQLRKITPNGVVSILDGSPYFTAINGLAIDTNNNLLVLNKHIDNYLTITKFNLSTKQYTARRVDHDGSFNLIDVSMKVDTKGNIYIHSNAGHGVMKIKANGYVSIIGRTWSPYDEFTPGNGTDAMIPSIYSMVVDTSNDNLYLMAFGQILRVDTTESVSAVTGRWYDQWRDRIFRVDNGKMSILHNTNRILYTTNVYGVGTIPFMDNYGRGFQISFQETVNYSDYDKRIRLDSTGAILGTPRGLYLSSGTLYSSNNSIGYSIVAANQYGMDNAPMTIRIKSIVNIPETIVTTTLPYTWKGRTFNTPTDTATQFVKNKTTANDTLYTLHLLYEVPSPAITATGNCSGGQITLTANNAAQRSISFNGSNVATIKNVQNGQGATYFNLGSYTKPDGSFQFNPMSGYELWIKPATVNGTQYLFTKDTVQSHGGFIGLSIQNGKLVYEFTKGSQTNVPYKLTSNVSIVPNVWTHVAASYFDSALHVYINGQEAGILQTPNNIFNVIYVDPVTNTNLFPDFYLGGLGRQFGYNGEMDELRVWATKRDKPTLLLTKDSLVSPLSTRLGLYYRFDDDLSDGATDISVSHRTANFIRPATSVSPSKAPLNYASYKWMPGGATTPSIVVAPASNTLYTLTVTDYKGTAASDTFRVKSRVSNSIETVRFCGASYTWHGTTYTSSTNTAIWTGVNQYGCDSIVKLNLTLLPPQTPVITGAGNICIGSRVTLSATGFSNYVWLPNGETTAAITVQPTATSTYMLKVKDANGCQSTASKTVVVGVPTSSTEKIVACNSYTWHGTTYTSSNNSATWAGVNAAGCDSVVTLNLLINPLPSPAIVSANGIVTCLGNPLQLTARASGKQLDLDGNSRVVADAMGVDPSNGFTLEGWVNLSGIGSPQSVISQTLSNTPLPFDAFVNANGTVSFAVGDGLANSSVTTTTALLAKKWSHLAFVYSNRSISIYIDGVLRASGAAVVPASGKLTNFMIGNNESLSKPVAGAVDEIRIWNVALSTNQITGNMNASVKPGSYGLVGYYKFDEGDDDLPVNTANGVATATSVGNAKHSVSTAPIVYQSYNWTGGATSPVLTAADAATLYTVSVTDVNGCSATTSGKAVVSSPTSSTEVVKACGAYTWHGVTYTRSNNTARWTTQNAAGCDSAVTLDLTIASPSASTETAIGCNSYVWHDQSYTKSTNTATWVGVNAAGCDSVVTLNLTIRNAIERTDTVVSCGAYRWHDSTYTVATNAPVWYGVSKSGCDSIVHLNLTMATLPVVKINATDMASSCPGSGIVLRNATKAFTKYATGVLRFSSETTGTNNQQILGLPNTYPDYGDYATAWSTKDDRAKREFVELTYDNAQPINFIDIYETLNSGTIDTVYVKNPGTGTFDIVYTGAAELYNQSLRNRISFPLTMYAVNTIRIAINSVDVPVQKGIDAVAIGVANTNSYRWSDGSTGDTLLAGKSGQYILTGTNEAGCSASDTINLVMPDSIKPIIVASSPTVCAGSSVTLQAPTGFASYQWSNGATTQSITVSQSGSYSVMVTTGGGCKSTASDILTITVKPVPAAPSVLVTNNCGSATLTAGGTGSFLWNNEETTSSIIVSTSGIYSVTQTVNGCTSMAASVTAVLTDIPAKPVITASGATAFYVGSSVTLQAPAGFASYLWSNGATTPAITVSQSGSFSVQVSNLSGCSSIASDPIVVTVNPLPSALYVMHLDGDNRKTTNNTIRPYLQLYNEGNAAVPYKDVTIRYWLTVEDFSPMTNLFIDWAQLGAAKVKLKYVKLPQPRQDAYGYIEYSFDATAGTLAPGSNSGPIQSRANKRNWTAFNETNDYSYVSTNSYTRNNRITVYQNGVLVGGTEPATIPIVQKLKAYSQDITISANSITIQPWLQVSNEGNTPVNYQDLTVRYWFTADGNQALKYTMYYSPLGYSAIRYRFQKLATPLSEADTYLELGFSVADSLYPASNIGTVLQGINKIDWSLFNQSNDHSYQVNRLLAENTHVTVYLKGQLVYGVEPAALAIVRLNSDAGILSTPASVEPVTTVHLNPDAGILSTPASVEPVTTVRLNPDAGILSTPASVKSVTTTVRSNQKLVTETMSGKGTRTADPLDLVVLTNPVTGPFLNFLVKGAVNQQVQVTVADSWGRIIARKSLVQLNAASQQKISINGIASGIVFLTVSTFNEQKTLRVMVDHK